MPRFYFHIHDGWTVIPDDEGMEFDTLRLAEVEGYASARDLATAACLEGRSCAAYAINVADEDGTILRQIQIEPLRFAS